MASAPTLTLDLRPRPVTLHHPGAEGVRFHDAVFAVSNRGATPIEGVRLRLVVAQGGCLRHGARRAHRGRHLHHLHRVR